MEDIWIPYNYEIWDKNVSIKTSNIFDLENKISIATSKLLLDDIKTKNNTNYNFIYNKNTETIIIDNIENIDLLKQNDLEEIILDIIVKAKNNWIDVKKIDISKYIKKWNIKKEINWILSKNYPILTIHRFIDDSEIIMFRFLWIKDINDNVSKEFSDLFINEIKKYLEENFKKKNLKDSWKSRLVWSNYKNITFSTPKWDIKIDELLELGRFKNINNFINFICGRLNKNNEIDEIIKISKISNKTEIIKILKKYFNIWEWNSLIENNTIQWKIETHYKTTQNSKNNLAFSKEDNINKQLHSFDKLKQLSQEINDIKKELLNSETTFSCSWNNNLEIILNWEINPVLHKKIRLWKKIFYKWKLKNNAEELIKKYINLLNSWFSYFNPTLMEYKDKDIKVIEKQWSKLNSSIQTWIIDTDSLVKNYKWFYSKLYIENVAKKNEWTKMFIDIMWNQLENMKEFIKAAKKVNNWKINSDNIQELLDICTPVTKKIIEPLKLLITKYPQLIISIIWDEVYIFIENKYEEKNNISKIINDINIFYNEKNLKIRTTYTKSNKINFENLDLLTWINKYFENKVEEVTWISLNKSLNVDISDEIKKELFQGKNLEKNYKNLTSILDEIDFTSDEINLFFKNEIIRKISLEYWWLDIILVKNKDWHYYEIIIKKQKS